MKTMTIQTKTARESVATIQAIRTTKARTDNTAKAARIQTHHRSSNLFLVFNLFQYRDIKTITIQTRTARDSVAHIHANQTIIARTDKTVFCFFFILSYMI